MWIEKRVSKLLPLMPEHKRRISLFFFLSESTNVPHPMPGRTSAAGSAVHFCCRAALRLLWQHQKQRLGLDPGHVVENPGKEEVVRRNCGELVFMFLYHQRFWEEMCCHLRSTSSAQTFSGYNATPQPSFPVIWNRLKGGRAIFLAWSLSFSDLATACCVFS